MVSHDVDNDFDLNVQVIMRDDVAHALHSAAQSTSRMAPSMSLVR